MPPLIDRCPHLRPIIHEFQRMSVKIREAQRTSSTEQQKLKAIYCHGISQQLILIETRLTKNQIASELQTTDTNVLIMGQ